MKFNFSMRPLTIIVAVLALIFVLHYLTRTSIIEGLTNNPSQSEFIAKGLKNDITTLQDGLLLSKYQSNYKEILKNMIEWSDLQILKTLVSNKLNLEDGVSNDNTQLITSLNQYSEFKNTIQNVYDNVLMNVSS